MGKTLCLLLIGWLTPISLYAQFGSVESRLRTIVTKLEVGKESGSGFVIGAAGDSIYIATANHVVITYGRVNQLKVALNGRPLKVEGAQVYLNTLNYDVAFIRVYAPGFRWEGPGLCESPHEPDVFFVSALTGARVPEGNTAFLASFKAAEHFFEFSLADVDRGDSGSALANSKGVIGMIVSRGELCRAIEIDFVRKMFFSMVKKSAWQLK